MKELVDRTVLHKLLRCLMGLLGSEEGIANLLSGCQSSWLRAGLNRFMAPNGMSRSELQGLQVFSTLQKFEVRGLEPQCSWNLGRKVRNRAEHGTV